MVYIKYSSIRHKLYAVSRIWPHKYLFLLKADTGYIASE